MEHRCRACQHENPAGSRFCNQCGGALGASSESGLPAHVSERAPLDYTPSYVADRILRSRHEMEGERKWVTVLFVDVIDSVGLSERIGAETLHFAMDGMFRRVADVVHRFEGTVNQYTGDGVMSLFGAPVALEDHALRACQAALRVKQVMRRYAAEVMREHGVDFRVRTGLGSGEVVVGRIGDDLRMDYTAQGRVVGLAKRAEHQAPAGEILLSESCYERVASEMECDPLGPVPIRGLSNEEPLYRLKGPQPGGRGTGDAQRAARFVGREAELARLVRALEGAEAGSGSRIEIVGGPGVGKSRLCREFAAACRGAGVPVAETRGVAHATQVPLLPILGLVRGALGVPDEGEPERGLERLQRRIEQIDAALLPLLPTLGDFLGLADDPADAGRSPEDRQQRRESALRQVLEAACRQRPLMVLVEDLQWLDPASRRFMGLIGELVDDHPLVLVVNGRPGGAPLWDVRVGAERLELDELDADSRRLLIEDRVGPELAKALAGPVAERARGNPLYIEQTLHFLIEEGVITGSPGSMRTTRPIEEVAVPPELDALIQHRIDRLEPAAKTVLLTASALGERFGRRLLEAVADVPSLDPELAALVDKGFLRVLQASDGSRVGFEHPLVQEVAYASQLGPSRRRIHARIATQLEEATAPPPEVAHHWDRAGSIDRAVRWHQRAARWAEVRNPEAALASWSRQRELLAKAPANEERNRRRLRAVTQILHVGGARVGLAPAQVEALVGEGRAVARELGATADLARLLEAHGAALGYAGDLPGMQRAVEEAIAIAEGLDDAPLRGGLFHRLTFANVHTGSLRDALRRSEREATAARCEPPCSPLEVFAELGPTATLIILRAAGGDLAGAAEAKARCERLFDAAGLRDGNPILPAYLQFSAMLAWYRGDADEALRHADLLTEQAGRSHSAWERAMASWSRGMSQLLAGRGESAAFSLDAGLEQARRHRVGLEGEADYLAFLAMAHHADQRLHAAVETSAEALRIARERGARWWEVRAILAHAGALLDQRGARGASEVERLLARGHALVEETGAFAERAFLCAISAKLHGVMEDEAGARAEAERAATLFEDMGAPLRAAAMRSGAPPFSVPPRPR